MQNLPKHKKYKQYYKPNDTFWGLGVEHETYLETSKLKQVTLGDLKECNKRERYSVDYLTVYNKEQLHKALDGLFSSEKQSSQQQQQKKEQPIRIPILMNAHSFQKTDIQGEHKTTYERIPKPNPNFNGKTIYEWMLDQNPDIFKEEYEKSYLFDGDTIEFVTQDFYKVTAMDVMHELVTKEKEFLRALNSLPREGLFKTYAPFKIAEKNYGFASYLTNLKNNAMFNNGTIHINITLPTKLNENAEIEDFTSFKHKHQNYARAIQWLSPLIVAKYGAHDPLSESEGQYEGQTEGRSIGELYAAGSQRVAISRYIGLGTYDTDQMEVGKILTKPKATLKDIDWYDTYTKKAAYNLPEDIGMDINFNKHYSHGLEIRILESLPSYELQEVIQTLIYLADYSLIHTVPNPKKSPLWHNIALNCIHNGKGYMISVNEQNILFDLLGIYNTSKEPKNANEVYDEIAFELMEQYKNNICSKAFLLGVYDELSIDKHDSIPILFKVPPTPPTTPTTSVNTQLSSLRAIQKPISLEAISFELRPVLETITEINTESSDAESVTTATATAIATTATTTSQTLSSKKSIVFPNISEIITMPLSVATTTSNTLSHNYSKQEEVPIIISKLNKLKWLKWLICC